MRPYKIAALIAIITTPVVIPAGGQAKSLEAKYTDLYYAVAKKDGARAPGRNIRKYGLRTPGGRTIKAQPRHLARSIRTFRRWLAPPVPIAAPSDRRPTTVTTSQPAYAGGKWSIPAYIVMCESGGDYRVYNKSGSGASGAYQIMPETWRRYGGSTANAADASPAEQDRVAARIYAAEGTGPWTCR